jgi:alpha-glucosidase (family GH31 glycosyl hydrolase)
LTWLQDDDPFAIVGAFTQLTGPAALPPAWVFGLWMSSNEWNSEARVREEVETSLAHGIVPGVVVIEAWSDEATFYIWNDATYEPKPGAAFFRYADFKFPAHGKWPDPKGMVDWLHAQDIRLLLWQIPVLKAADGVNLQHENDRAHFLDAGYAVADPDGSPHRIRPFWFRGGEIWDVTNAEARSWWMQKRAYLVDDLGIDGFKTDGGEHLWSEFARFADGRRGDEVWNEYAKLYSQTYFDFINRRTGAAEADDRQAVTFSRAGFTGSQRSPLHWAGDENSTWDAFRHSILAGLSAGISGIPFWGWDFGGFSGEIPSAELYLRGMAMATFCPILQYHAEYNAQRKPNRDRTPWNIQARTGDERVVPTARFFVNLRHNLLPYIWQEAQYAAASGRPLMRSLQVLDAAASAFDYLFGRDLLVSPVIEADATRWPVYLPAGRWHDLWTGEPYAGQKTATVEVPINRIPVFIRHGAKIPVNLAPSRRLGDAVESVHGSTTAANQVLAAGESEH